MHNYFFLSINYPNEKKKKNESKRKLAALCSLIIIFSFSNI